MAQPSYLYNVSATHGHTVRTLTQSYYGTCGFKVAAPPLHDIPGSIEVHLDAGTSPYHHGTENYRVWISPSNELLSSTDFPGKYSPNESHSTCTRLPRSAKEAGRTPMLDATIKRRSDSGCPALSNHYSYVMIWNNRLYRVNSTRALLSFIFFRLRWQ
uniref:Isoleucine--tRNA ligase n=1 Tax=Talaromyces marneffei PM1 TaxID=1077442 RepID=A0A093UZI8_TALMA